MRPIDDDLVTRAVAWCAEAGRQTSPGEVRAALEALGWDEQLAARALLADPPPARPLGPLALADIARGAPPAVAAERERDGKYLREGAREHQGAPSTGEPSLAPSLAPRRAAAARAAKEKKRARGGGPVIRRMRDRVEPTRPEPAGLPGMDELFAPEGRAVLERLLRENGARRGKIVAALATAWRRPDGCPPTDDDLSRLLDVHGLSRSFERRERDELLYSLRAAAGSRARAAATLGLTPAAFDASLARLGGARQAEAIEAAHREELRRRATLGERVRLLVAEAERLGELGLLAEIEADVRQRLPQHLRALRASGAAPLPAALARSLTVAPADVTALAARLRLELGLRGAPGTPPGGPAQGPSPRHRSGARPRPSAASPAARDRPAPARGRLTPGRAPASQPHRGPQPDRAGEGGGRRRLGPRRGEASPRSAKSKPSRRGPGRTTRRGP